VVHMMHEGTRLCYSCVQLRRDGDAVQVFAVSPVSDSSEAERRQDGSRILSPEIPVVGYFEVSSARSQPRNGTV